MKTAKKALAAALALLVSALLLTGCIPQHYVPSHEDKLCDAGREILQRYLDEKHPSAELGDVICLHAVHYTGAYLTDYISSSYTEGEDTVGIATDLSTGVIYTSEHYEELKEACVDSLTDTLGISDDQIIDTEKDAYLLLTPVRDGEVIDSLPDYIYVELRMLLEDVTDVREYLADSASRPAVAADMTYSLKESCDIGSYFTDDQDELLSSLPFEARNIRLKSYSESLLMGNGGRYDRFAFAEEGDLIIRYPELIDDRGIDEDGNINHYRQTFEYGKDLKITEKDGGYDFDVSETSPEFSLTLYTPASSPIAGKTGTFEREDGQTAEITGEKELLNSSVVRLAPKGFFPLDVTGRLTFN